MNTISPATLPTMQTQGSLKSLEGEAEWEEKRHSDLVVATKVLEGEAEWEEKVAKPPSTGVSVYA